MAFQAPPPRPWHPPVAPFVIERAYRDAPRFEAGARRSVSLRARAGDPVRAPCSGTVTFRGAVGGGPPVVTLRCGPRRATVRGLRSSVEVGSWQGRDARLGTATGGVVTLSARRADGTYLDPVALLVAAGKPSPVPPLPSVRRPRLPKAPAQEPWVPVDRALVSPQSVSATPASAAALSAPPQRASAASASAAAERAPAGAAADGPLGLAGSALAGLAAAGALWAWARRRVVGRRPEHRPRRAVLARHRQ